MGGTCGRGSEQRHASVALLTGGSRAEAPREQLSLSLLPGTPVIIYRLSAVTAIYRCCEYAQQLFIDAVNSWRALGEVISPDAIPSLRFSSVIPPPVFSVHGRSLTPPTTTLVRETPLRYPSLFSCCFLGVSVCVCVSVCVFLVCVVCLSLPPRASSMGGGARDACSVDSRVRGQAFWGELPWPCPFHRSPSS